MGKSEYKLGVIISVVINTKKSGKYEVVVKYVHKTSEVRKRTFKCPDVESALLCRKKIFALNS